MDKNSETAAVRRIHAAARDSEQLIIIREQTGDGGSRETAAAVRRIHAVAGRQIHTGDQMPNSWNYGQRLGDSGREMDPHSGSDAGRMRPDCHKKTGNKTA